jgi:TonB family protein
MLRWASILLLIGCAITSVAQDQPDVRPIANRVAPSYPDLARRMNLQGSVRLRVTVAPDGSAQSIETIGGNPVLVKAAQDAVNRWKWVPGPKQTKEVVELKFVPAKD